MRFASSHSPARVSGRGLRYLVAGLALLTACADSTAPARLLLRVDGRLERGSALQLRLSRGAAAIPSDSVRWTVTPARIGSVDSAGRLLLRDTGSVAIVAVAGSDSASATGVVLAPPDILFDAVVEGNRDIYRVSLDGVGLTRLTTDPAEDLMPTTASGVVVFTSFRNGNAELYAVPADGGLARRLTTTTANETEAALTPDGSGMAYISDAAGVGKLWRSAADTGAPSQPTAGFGFAGEVEAHPSWAPAGDRLVFVSTASGSAQLYVLALGGGTITPLAANGTSVEPAWSPDGRSIVFTSSRDGDAALFLLPAAGGLPRRLTPGPSAAGQAAWLPDGRIVYTDWSAGPPQLRWLDPAAPDTSHAIAAGSGPAEHPAAVHR